MIINKEYNKIKNIYLIVLLYNLIYHIIESFIKLTNLIDFILMDLSNFLARA